MPVTSLSPSYHLHLHANPFCIHVYTPDPSEFQNYRYLTLHLDVLLAPIVGAWDTLFVVGIPELINKFITNYQLILVGHFL